MSDKLITIGTDVDYEINKSEGYLMCDYPEFMDSDFDANVSIRFFAYYPEYCDLKGLMTDSMCDCNELYEIYLENKDSIDSFIGMTYSEKPNDIQTMLSLASDINSYQGLP